MCLIDNAFMTDERALDEQARRELTMLRVDATNEYRDARGAITEKRYAAGTMSSGGFVGEVEAAATRIFHSFAKTSMNRLIELADIGFGSPAAAAGAKWITGTFESLITPMANEIWSELANLRASRNESAAVGHAFDHITRARQTLEIELGRLALRGNRVAEALENATSTNKLPTGAAEAAQDWRVFVVHGHDEAMKQSVCRALERLRLHPVVLHEQPNKGRTIIEKFTDHANVGFAVILLSPDDVGKENDENATLRPRPRQNVVLELGFFLGRLGRNRVMALVSDTDGFELPSDYSGVVFTPYDLGGAWRTALVHELQAASYKVDANAIVAL